MSARDPGPKPAEVSPESLVWAIVAVSVGGLAILIGLVAVMKEANLGVNLIIAFTLLSFLILIGVALVAEGFHQKIPKGYIYFSMAFSAGVEVLNMKFRKKSAPVQLHEAYSADSPRT